LMDHILPTRTQRLVEVCLYGKNHIVDKPFEDYRRK